ncbi:type III secretion system outer membrane ring subunit SctC [Prosthecobacter dejongeii]|uniref:Type III secretion protein C n=1 Tax=Prosthecobacter dejongeii TaxID=48465 RepID=A0A7W7YK61_9BACT|nr:type III secretion system outer membrane ring subunit SctC [Prosthecobacter dejongeii]MBB5037720.1 type III secretion protein C [Prosthecobacter dejongeii]
MMNLSRPFFITFCLALGAFSWSELSAQEYDRIPWRAKRVSFQAQQRSVRDLLKELMVSQNLPVSISDSVKGVTSGSFKDVETQAVFDQLCEAHELVWFYDGVRMVIESADEVISRPLALPYLTPEALNEVLFSIGYASGPKGREVQIKPGHRSGVLLLVGGPQFIQATELLARDLDNQENQRINEQITVRTFRLNYASANDINVNTGTTNRVVPGVVSSLQRLMANQPAGSLLSTGVEETSNRVTRPGLRGKGLAAIGNPAAATPPRPFNPYDPTGSQQAQGQGAPPLEAVEETDPRAPMIVADTRLNAVLVRDVAARMPLYEELIRMLDVQTKAIEITAAIVDVDSDNLRNVGVEILGLGKNGNDLGRLGFDADRGIFDGNNTQGQTPSFFDGSNLARGAGLNATALISAGGYELLTRLRAVEEVGAGQIVSSPSVLTMENVQAVIRTDEKVYVRVEGNLQVDLFDVTTGIQLRVTPTIVREGVRNDFRLQIDITDGSFSDTRVDNIPSTRESAINTQAMVPENKTLLLGGYSVERRVRNTRQVPLLSKVPGLGKLFSRNERNHERTQRFFFITPRIVDLSTEATDPANYTTPDGNELALPSYLTGEQTSREKVEDLARRLAAGIQTSPPEIAGSGKRPNALLPAPASVPRAMSSPDDEGVTPPPTPSSTGKKNPIPAYPSR